VRPHRRPQIEVVRCGGNRCMTGCQRLLGVAQRQFAPLPRHQRESELLVTTARLGVLQGQIEALHTLAEIADRPLTPTFTCV